MFLVANTVSNVIDELRKREKVSTRNARKIAMTLGRFEIQTL